MEQPYFYITTTLPYVNADPHIGFALEIVQADAIARYQRLHGKKVIFNFGTDEHGQKIYQKALETELEPQEYCNQYAQKFNQLKTALNVSYNHFIRTTDPHHIKAAQHFWELCYNNGDIYKKTYPIKYCVGCELEKTDSELVNKRCPWHPNNDLEIIEEENYFFRWSKYQDRLLKLYKDNPDFVLPESKLSEIVSFVSRGLQDFSISRLKEKMPWGIPVPHDTDHVMYVWFDALINYISTLGWPNNKQQFEQYWLTADKQANAIQIAGKDNLRQQTAMWQAMLMSAGITTSKQILIHGFLTVNDQKISKSLGNVINPITVAEKYSTDALRYYLLSEISPFGDSDYSELKFIEKYNADLANGLGNLVSRTAKLCQKCPNAFPLTGNENKLNKQVNKYMENYQYNQALHHIWQQMIGKADKLLSEQKPWKLSAEAKIPILKEVVLLIRQTAYNLQIFLPKTADKISKHFASSNITEIAKPLFPRIKE